MSTENIPSRSPVFWVPTLYIAQGLPFFAVNLVAGIMFKSLGESNQNIALWTGLLGWVWVLKPLWSPFLEVARSKKFLIVCFQLIGGTSLGMVALALQLPSFFAMSIAMLGIVAISAATHDIAADGLYIASLNQAQQTAFAGWLGAFFNAAKLFSAGGLVMLAGHLEKSMPPAQAWSIVFAITGSILLTLGLYHSWSLPNTQNVAIEKSMRSISLTLLDVIIEFFKKPGIWFAIVFILLFRAAEGQIQTIGPLFLKELKANGGLGLDNEQIGFLYGAWGTVAFVLGSILGGYFISWLGLKRAMPWLIIAMNLPNIVFFFLSTKVPDDMLTIGACLGIETFGYGFGFVGLILFMMQVVAVGKYQTAHYALATGVMQLGLVIPKMLSGEIQVRLGYQSFFIWVMISAIPVLILSRFIKINPGAEAKSETL